MARIKGGLNAKKKHNRTLKLAKGSKKESEDHNPQGNEAFGHD